MSAFSRVPIRLRLTLVFTLAMVLVLSVTGLFVYFRNLYLIKQKSGAASN